MNKETTTAADWIAEQRRIEQAATEGPWDTSTTSWAPEARMVDVPDGDDEMSLAWEAGGGLCVMSRADAEFIANARTALPKALAALDAVLALIRARTRTPAEDGSVDEYDYVGELADDILAAIEQALDSSDCPGRSFPFQRKEQP